MAIYHMRVQVLGRSSGRSAVAAAAYRAGVRLADERTGEVHDFTAKAGVVHSEIALPEGAPERFLDRSALWNEVERVSKGDRAQLARELELALPRELDRDQQIALCRAEAAALAAQGMVVDWSIHDKGDGNPHVHMLCTMRSVGPEGFLPKSRIAYLCRDEGGREAWMSGDELAGREGWEKVFRFAGVPMSLSEAAEVGLGKADRDSRQPVKDRVMLNDWDERERVPEWREQWEAKVNAALAEAQRPERVDCRSLVDQGELELMPSLHMGPAAAAIERREQAAAEREGRPYEPVTEVGKANAARQEHNERVLGLREQLREAVREGVAAIREQVDRLRDQAQAIAARLAGRDQEPQADPRQDFERACEAYGRALAAKDEAQLRESRLDSDRPESPQEAAEWERDGQHAAERRAEELRGTIEERGREQDQDKAELERLQRHPLINKAKIAEVTERIEQRTAELPQLKAELQKAEHDAGFRREWADEKEREASPAWESWKADQQQAEHETAAAWRELGEQRDRAEEALDRMEPLQAVEALDRRFQDEAEMAERMPSDEVPRIAADLAERQVERAVAEVPDQAKLHAALSRCADALDGQRSYRADEVRDQAKAALSRVPAAQQAAARAAAQQPQQLNALQAKALEARAAASALESSREQPQQAQWEQEQRRGR